ncbi:hypothetical protein FPI77_21245 [Klebsiella quasivariicola]|nr:hypothetical protein B8P98_19310 [Klebsiella quasivariicola]NBZ73524.1 hypothetical protein [Klebsiella quasivariicola]TTM68981.1 hypothetical protein FPI77_21245 [Klebsiella quasivariicola]
MGHSCGQNSENAYYGRKAARAVCHLARRLYIAGRTFYIQKLYKTFSNIMISIPLFLMRPAPRRGTTGRGSLLYR